MSNDAQPDSSDSASPFSGEMAQYLQVYIDESQEELEGLIEAILRLEENPRDAEALHKSFRMLHSLKGSSGMLGFEVVGNFAHELEGCFERYRSGQAVLDSDTTTLVLKCVDFFRSFLDRLRANDLTEGDPSSLLDQLRNLEERHEASHPASLEAVQAEPARAGRRAETISGGLKIVVRFSPGLQLADLKARLIVSRLSAIGEIIHCEPPIDDVSSFDELPLFSLTLVTDRGIEEVRKIASVDGVESLEFQGSASAPELVVGNQAATPDAFARPQSPPSRPDVPVSAGPSSPDQESFFEEPRLPSNQPTPSEAITDAADVKAPHETLRVDIGRLDDLLNLTGELVVSNARFTQITAELKPVFHRGSALRRSSELMERLRQRFAGVRQLLLEGQGNGNLWAQITEGLDDDLDGLNRQAELWEAGHRHFSAMTDAVDQLARVSKNLQRGVLNTRMVPVGPLFNRFKRVVRDLAVERRKQVQLSIQGEKTELDKRMIDSLGDPLLHLVRNSIDHGLESTEERSRAGKPDFGTISLEAAHRGNNVIISVRDDGGGINTDKIRSRIIKSGLASGAQVGDMTEQQVIDYIWHPGFSTAESVSEISGRGVGMDIVRNAISNLAGTIDVASLPGSGTVFTIRLPLTLAIIHSLLIRYRGDHFSIPIDDVREIVSVPREQIHAVHRHLTIEVRGELIPLVSMGGVFTWNDSARRSPGQPVAASGAVNVVVLQARGKTVGLSVDSLVGRSDLVIKSLSENYLPVRGLSGASILGDGAVCLMLDSASLVELAAERLQSGATI